MKFSKIFLFTLTLILSTITTTLFPIATPYSYKIILNEGITFTHDIILNYDQSGGNQEINYIELDLTNPNINLSLIQANDVSSSKETLIEQLEEERLSTGKNIIGGINGEFFQLSNGQLLFTTISENEIFSIIDTRNESLNRPIFYVDSNKNFGFDNFTIFGTMKFLDNRFNNLTINSLNKLDSYNDVNVSNYKINLDSTYYPHEGLPSRYMIIELHNSNGNVIPGFDMFGTVVEVGEMNEPKQVKKNQILITSYGDENYSKISYDFLNSVVSLRFDIFSENNKAIKNDIITAFTGHEYLIKNNQSMDSSYYNTLAEPSLISSRNSRTALGITTENKIILFTVDKSSNSLGMTLDELSTYLKSLGVENAINLDGGGSTSISFENNEKTLFIMNDINKHKRAITNSISVIYNKK